MWLFQDWTVGTAAEIFNTWADEYIAQHPEVKSITFVGKPDTCLLYTSGPLAGYKVAGGGLAFAGKLRKLFDRYVNICLLYTSRCV